MTVLCNLHGFPYIAPGMKMCEVVDSEKKMEKKQFSASLYFAIDDLRQELAT